MLARETWEIPTVHVAETFPQNYISKRGVCKVVSLLQQSESDYLLLGEKEQCRFLHSYSAA